ncbi:hypothetical protein EDC01DRAFT_632092 [Geopyxis carbonaria]|nr:hypothetical protein EDC01DRAFT_632092 [Geopyxis carbonaria]
MGILKPILEYLSLHPQQLQDPVASLHLAQQAPAFLASSEATNDSQETWIVYERLFLACLRVQDDHSARLLLQRLGDRFGVESSRVRALAGLQDEATASSRHELEEVLFRYEKVLSKDPTNMPIEKRRVTLLQSLGRTEHAITALTKTLEHSPTDAESWSQLASLYRAQGLYTQSIFCLEEVLLIHPNAYNIHARLGETTLISGSLDDLEALSLSTRYFCRSVELCEWYIRGWYGLKLVTDSIMAAWLAKPGKSVGDLIDLKTAEFLNEKAFSKLGEILRRAKSGDSGWQGFNQGELDAASELIEVR